jgi:Flp pilus assembly protein TadG
MLALAIDLSRFYLAREELQKAAEAAALAGVIVAPAGTTAVDDAVRTYMTSNLTPSSAIMTLCSDQPTWIDSVGSVTKGTFVGMPNVVVNLGCTLRFTLGAVALGLPEQLVTANASAVLASEDTSGPLPTPTPYTYINGNPYRTIARLVAPE